MADLLTDLQRAQIKAVLGDVTDTFHKTPVTLFKLTGESVDKVQEDNRSRAYTQYSINALISFPDEDKDDVQREDTGAYDGEQVELQIAFKDFVALSLTSGNKVTLNKTTDEFTANGSKYKIDYLAYDGQLDATPILVMIKGSKKPAKE